MIPIYHIIVNWQVAGPAFPRSLAPNVTAEARQARRRFKPVVRSNLVLTAHGDKTEDASKASGAAKVTSPQCLAHIIELVGVLKR